MREIIISSDSNHDKVYAEIYYKDKFVALVSQENKARGLEIEFPGTDVDQNLVSRNIPLNKFKELLERATAELA